MKIRIPLTAHYNGVLEDDDNGHVMGCIGDYVRIDAGGGGIGWWRALELPDRSGGSVG